MSRSSPEADVGVLEYLKPAHLISPGLTATHMRALACLACPQVHMVHPKTGKVLGADEE